MESCTSVIASIPQANSNGYDILFSHKMICYIFDQHEQKICSTQINKGDRLYYMDIEALLQIPDSTGINIFIPPPESSINSTMTHQVPLRKKPRNNGRASKETRAAVYWLHRCMHHASPNSMIGALSNNAWLNCGVTATMVQQVFNNEDCPVCMLSRAKRLPRTIGSGSLPPAIAASISADFVPVSVTARGGFTGYYIFRELLVGYLMVVLVKSKDFFLKAVLLVRSFFLQHGHHMHYLIVDAGKVENAVATKTVLNQIGIVIQTAAPECQFQNPVERSQQTLANAVTAALGDQDALDNAFWGLALTHCTATLNAIPNVLSGEVSPMYAVTGRHQDFQRQFLYPFGQAVVVVRLKQEGRDPFKFSTPGEIGFVVAITESGNGSMQLYIPSRSRTRVYFRRDVRPIQFSSLTPAARAPMGEFIENMDISPT
jgi:hypothetical protein